MRLLTYPLLILVLSVPAIAQELYCGPNGKMTLRTTLGFGLNRKSGGKVTTSQWKTFLRTEVTPRFPEGFTVIQTNGQWRMANGRVELEKSRMLIVDRDDSPQLRQSVSEIVDIYKRKYDQEAVFWETARVCAGF